MPKIDTVIKQLEVDTNRLLLKDIKVGDFIRFEEEGKKYEIQARSGDFLVLNKPFARRRRRGMSCIKTVIYTIIDLERQIRGVTIYTIDDLNRQLSEPGNLLYRSVAETRLQCEEMLERLLAGDTEVSHRNNVPLRIKKIIKAEDASKRKRTYKVNRR